MALSVETGLFSADTADATTTVSCGFTGKAIILFTTGQTAEGSDSAANVSWSYGFSDGTNHRVVSWASDDNVATTNCGRWWGNASIAIINSNGNPTSLITITGVTFGASSFNITWSGTPAAAYKVGYILLGGSDITDVVVGTQTLTTSTGAQSVTGLAFQPDFGIFINAQTTASTSGTRALGSIGFAASSTKEFTMCWGVNDGQTMTGGIDAVNYTNQDACMSGITAGAETVDFLADFTSFNSDGYTINVSNAPTAGWLVGYLLIKGGQWDVGTTTIPGAGSTRTISGLAFQPKGVGIGTTRTFANATVETEMSSVFGVATSTSTEASISAGQADAVLNTTVIRRTLSTRLWAQSHTSASYSADFDAFTSDGFQFTGNSTDGSTTTQLGWFACGDAAVSAPLGKLMLPALLARRRFGLVP